MQVDIEPFLMNMINFDDKKSWFGLARLIRTKARRLSSLMKTQKISCRKVVAEKTLNEGETLKIIITTSNAMGQAQTSGQARHPILHSTDSPACRRERSSNTQEQ
jgi:hypothetical protein